MIRDIIIPENIGSYYIFSKRVLSIEIGKTEVHAVLTLLSGKRRFILNIIEEKIEQDPTISYEEKILNSLNRIKQKIKNYNYIITVISSSVVIFKEISLPFLSKKKAKIIAPFEVESLLPFNLDEVIIDSIVTKEDKINKKTDILVTAVKKDYLNNYISIFDKAKLKVDKISIDMLELYGLYTNTDYYKKNNNSAIIDFGYSATRILIILDKQIRYIRVIQNGIINIAKKISSDLNIELNEIINQLVRFGVNITEPDKHNQINIKIISELFQEIKFTIENYLNKLEKYNKIDLALITGPGADIPGIKDIAQDTLLIDTQIFEIKKILNNSEIKSNINQIGNSFLITIAASIEPLITQDFNLYKEKDLEQENNYIKKQLIALILLLLLIITTFSIYSYLRIKKLKNAINSAEIEALDEIKKSFKLKNIKNLSEANKKATLELQQQENAWQQLSIKNRYSMINYLSELSKCLNPKQEIKLDLVSLEIKNNKIMLYGSVPDYAHLVKLQNKLKCNLFKNVPKLQDYNFKNEPIILNIND